MDIVKVRFRNDEDFLEGFDSTHQTGRMFCPTTNLAEDGAAVIVEVKLPSAPNKVLIRGTVVGSRSAVPRLRVRAGIWVEFAPEESSKRDYLLAVAGGDVSHVIRRKHDRVPVTVDARFRQVDHADFEPVRLSEISAGGALLEDLRVPLGTDLIVEIVTPGAVTPLTISGKATYHTDSGGTGVRFLYRDAGGARRLKEVVRRLIKH